MHVYVVTSARSVPVPSAPPPDLRGHAVDSHTIKVLWDPLPPEKQNGVLLGYTVLYAAADSGLGITEANEVATPAQETSVMISDLEKYMEYNVWVSAFTRQGNGPRSQVMVIQTDEDGMFSHHGASWKTRSAVTITHHWITSSLQTYLTNQYLMYCQNICDALFPLLHKNCPKLELLIMVMDGLGISCHSIICRFHNFAITVNMCSTLMENSAHSKL